MSSIFRKFRGLDDRTLSGALNNHAENLRIALAAIVHLHKVQRIHSIALVVLGLLVLGLLIAGVLA